ncbi:hypothetical protein CBM2605_B100247 [Cupriavidus neocaledonicus]|uniref:Uncharacterized protein n=1 Tax=Cupriavidus neocaledonicus TaxID=1040979 RepID=A0ABY1V6C8_9BURK|nr:hypothetical protein CBM2605_B100247 [Cupriavidus neocaledonicus]
MFSTFYFQPLSKILGGPIVNHQNFDVFRKISVHLDECQTIKEI